MTLAAFQAPMASSHYDEAYYAYQRAIGELGADMNAWKFESHLGGVTTIIDFGCGGGMLLERLAVTRKIGIEPNPVAQAEAARRGIEVYAAAADLPSAVADLVISNHALEHTLNPLQELRELRRALRKGGSLVICVPFDDWRSQKEPDPNHHLFTWTPLLLKNLLGEAGFTVLESRMVTVAWPPGAARLRHYPGFRVMCWAMAVLVRRRQVYAVAEHY